MEFSTREITDVYAEISPHIVNTPIIHSATFSDICHCRTLFKLENLQMTGSFKERGALNRLNQLTDDERQRGVIAASAGNPFHQRHYVSQAKSNRKLLLVSFL